MKRFFFLTFLICVTFNQIQAQQKQALEHEDFAIWNQINRKLISNNGNWVSYVVQPGEGNPVLYLYDGVKQETNSMERADNCKFSKDSKYLFFTIHPDHDAVKALKRAGKKKKDLPKDTLAVYNLATGDLLKLENASALQVPDYWSDWAFYQQEVEVSIEDEEEKTEKRTDIIAHHLPSGDKVSLEAGSKFQLAKKAAAVIAHSKGVDEGREAGIYLFKDKQWMPIHQQEGKYEQMSIAEKGDQVAFLANFDTTESRIVPFDLFYWSSSQGLKKSVDRAADFLAEDWLISKNGQLSFSQNGKQLFFGVAPPPVLKDTSLLPEEEVSVEVWNYKDPILYTQQEIQAGREMKRTYRCVLFTDNQKVMQLANQELPEVRLSNEGNGNHVLAYTDRPYVKSVSWDGGPSAKDVYLIDLANGNKKQIATALMGNPAFSPEGKFVYWYNSQDTAWFAYQIAKDKLVRLTNNSKVPFYDELNDRPMLPSSYGYAGWTKDDDFVLLYDRYDVWYVDPSEELASNNLTNGRKDKVRSRYVWLDRDERAIEEVKPMLMHFFNEESKQEGYYWFNIHTGVKKMVQKGDFSFARLPLKAKDANSWLFTKESYQQFPDLYYSRDNNLEGGTKISDANPQQENYNWGSIETYEWTSTDGQKLKGLLVKPEGFDPDKKYPMIVNFYERSSQGLNRHRTPTPHRSTINYPFYASRGYLIFNPDVPYTIGYPGESAYNSVVSGVTSLIDEGFVDKDNIGLQGHSWGGYQIAHIITKTDMFKCAESGAPVVNMISAYGGIRWGSGMSRMFQYERTQSRIGGTLWDKPIRYIENSPIFFADKINTPVLILHNDKDGAVPWYQGIEFFVAMRRLGKPAWMLNYNDEPHWPLKLQNRKDFQLRMSQFFDYYLKGAAMPRWMDEGVPATEKGIDQRLELMDGKH